MTVDELVGMTRDDLVAALPELGQPGAVRGGRAAALALLAEVKPGEYERSRNFLDGKVTQLSAYLRHGVLTLAEVRDDALRKEPQGAGKLVNELAWRDYWQRLYFQLGEGVWVDREEWKTGYKAKDYARELPGEIAAGTTTLACMDGFAGELAATGYLHNHARMWTAAYVVHWRRVMWQAGARWFLEHLLDGDPASNNLSWQWVASTFASKAYIFNRENLERYTAGRYCRVCVHAQDRTCPFEDSYEGLTDTLFPMLVEDGMPGAPAKFVPEVKAPARAKGQGTAMLWVHTDGLNPAAAEVRAHGAGPAVFVWDTEWLRASAISLKRVVFLAECVAEMPGQVEIRAGDVGAEVLAAARAAGAGYVLAQRTPDPRLLAAARVVEKEMPVVWFDPPAFAGEVRAMDLKRFSRYWGKAKESAMRSGRG